MESKSNRKKKCTEAVLPHTENRKNSKSNYFGLAFLIVVALIGTKYKYHSSSRSDSSCSSISGSTSASSVPKWKCKSKWNKIKLILDWIKNKRKCIPGQIRSKGFC